MDNQAPRYCITPTVENADTRDGDVAIDLAAGYGLTLDPWQANAVRSWMRTDCNRRWCATTWGLSVPRQNGKNGALEAVELYLMAVRGLKILHTAHLLSTARKAFKRLMHFFGRERNDPAANFPELNALVVDVRRTNGQEAIELSNGGLIEVSARTSAAGRGTSFDVLVIDEAQEYEEDEQEALEPSTSASPSGQPVTIYMGTPPKTIGLRGEPFVRIRNAAVTGKSSKAAWVEHSAHGELDRMAEPELAAFVRDRRNWVDANPACPHRISLETIEGECEKWSPRSFARERLNMWPLPSVNKTHPITEKMWTPLLDEEPDPDAPLAAIGLDMNPERTRVTITMSTWTERGQHLELAADAPYDDSGESALVAWVKERAKWRTPVVIDAFSPARSLVPSLKAKRMKVYVLGASEFAEASMGLHDDIKFGAVSHFGQEQLTQSILGVTREPMGKAGAWKFSRESIEVALMPTVSAACAHYGAKKFGRRPREDAESSTKSGAHGFVG